MANRDPNLGRSTGTSGTTGDWNTEDTYWRGNWNARPYASADRDYDYYRPAFRYGFESGGRHRGRQWDEVEPELRSGWDRYEGRGESKWEHVKDAVRDAWHRVTNR